MNIAIIGPGALGSVFGALLSEAGHSVSLLASRPVYEEKVKAHGGLVLEQNGARRTVPCRLSCSPEILAGNKLLLVLVKTLQTAAAGETVARYMDPDCLVLTLQNGLGNPEALSLSIPPEKILAGTTTCAATLLEPGTVRLLNAGKNILGPWDGADPARCREIVSLLTEAGLSASIAENPRAAIWEKLFINIGSNALGAITGMSSGAMRRNPHTNSVGKAAITEAKAVAEALGIPVREDILEHFVRVGLASGDNVVSMRQDVEAKRLTEIDAINGAVARLGKEKSIPTPVNDTLTSLVRVIEGRYS